jgi:hypothetical protein
VDALERELVAARERGHEHGRRAGELSGERMTDMSQSSALHVALSPSRAGSTFRCSARAVEDGRGVSPHHRASVMSSSASMFFSTWRTPSSPATARPCRYGRPTPDCVGAQRERLGDVGAAAHARVEHDRQVVADGVDDRRQRVERPDRAVDLPAAVVGDTMPVDAVLARRARVVGMQDPLEQDRQLRRLAQEPQVVPGHRRVENTPTNWPTAACGRPRALLERRAEHRVGEVVRDPTDLRNGRYAPCRSRGRQASSQVSSVTTSAS